MNNSDTEEAIGYVNKIVDNVRCATCSKLEGPRLRYPCGHSTCDDCVSYTQDCPTCKPLPHESVLQIRPDTPWTQTVNNVANLLKASETLLDANVLQRKRISEQLRIEKELFPKCIQAPMKYENKRKSTNLSFRNKENRYSTFFPGEEVSSSNNLKMENMKNHVQQWLNKNERNLVRKPFADLHVNSQSLNHPKSKNIIKKNVGEKNVNLKTNNKRAHFKTINKDFFSKDENKLFISECVNTPKKIKKEFSSNSKEVQYKCDNDESGIFMDNDPIVIDDSQESIIDKDKNAWLAVCEASKNVELKSTSTIYPSQVKCTNDSIKQLVSSSTKKEIKITKVPFFKKGAILETCKFCIHEMNLVKPDSVCNQPKPVKITVDGDSFVTTITVFKNIHNNTVFTSSRNSVSVQTDDSQVFPAKDSSMNEQINVCDTNSEDLFLEDGKIFDETDHRTINGKCITIEESDSDTEFEDSGPMSVKADVHRSCLESEYGILTDLVNVREHESRPRPRPRGYTPTSTDSSEKENYNPNRKKERKHIKEKKKCPKK